MTDLLLAEFGEQPARPQTEEKGQRSEARGQKPEADETETAETATEGTEETEAETAEATEGEGETTETEGDEPAAEVEETEPKVSPTLQKRFNELTQARKEAEAEVVRLKAAANAKPPGSIELEVAAVNTADDLSALEARYQAWEDFAMANPDGVEIPARNGGEPVVYSAEQIRGLLMNMRRGLRAIPGRTRFIEQKVARDAEAHKAYPAFEDADSPLSKAYEATLQRHPSLSAVPDLKLLIADAARGRAQRLKPGQVQLAGKPVVRAAALPPSGRGAPARGAAMPMDKARQQADLRARVEKTGSHDDLEALLETKLRG